MTLTYCMQDVDDIEMFERRINAMQTIGRAGVSGPIRPVSVLRL